MNRPELTPGTYVAFTVGKAVRPGLGVVIAHENNESSVAVLWGHDDEGLLTGSWRRDEHIPLVAVDSLVWAAADGSLVHPVGTDLVYVLPGPPTTHGMVYYRGEATSDHAGASAAEWFAAHPQGNPGIDAALPQPDRVYRWTLGARTLTVTVSIDSHVVTDVNDHGSQYAAEDAPAWTRPYQAAALAATPTWENQIHDSNFPDTWHGSFEEGYQLCVDSAPYWARRRRIENGPWHPAPRHGQATP